MEALRALPGCDALEWPPPTGEDTVVVDTGAGTQLTLQMDPSADYGEWDAMVTHAGMTAEVSCELVDSNYFGETWTMSVIVRPAEGASRWAGSSPWALTAALIRSFSSTP